MVQQILTILSVFFLFITASAAASSPDGVRSQGGDVPVITLDNASQLEQVALLEGHTGPVFSLAFSPDSAMLASGGSGDDYTVRLWDVTSGTQSALLEGHSAQIAAVGFNADGTQALSASYDGSIIVWDAASGDLVDTITQTDDTVPMPLTVQDLLTFFTADGSKLVYGTYAYIYDLEARTESSAFDALPSLGVAAMAINPDATVVAVADFDGGIHVIDVESGEESALLQADNVYYYTALTISPDGTLLAAADGDTSNILLWSLEDDSAGPLLTGHVAGPGVYGLRFSPDSTMLASASYDGSVRLWDVTDGTELIAQTIEDAQPAAVVWSPDGTHLASGDIEGTVRLWAVTED